METSYFRPEPGAPPPLTAVCSRQVRFEEVDPLGIVWHGRYAGYFEDARVELGRRYGIGYMDLYREGILAPIKQMHVDFHLPLRFLEAFTIEGRLHWAEAARFNFDFNIRNGEGRVTTTGFTVQLLLDREERLQVAVPPFLARFRDRWREGRLG